MKLSSPFALLLLCSVPGAQALLTVDNDGPADFTTIRAAIAAAPPGATILVREGNYNEAGGGTISQPLVLVAEAGASVRVVNATFTVTGLAAGETVVVRGLTFAPSPLLVGMAVLDCAGSVWIEDVTIDGTGPALIIGKGALWVDDALVVLARSTIAGTPNGQLVPGFPGIFAEDATLHLFETQVTGGVGGGGNNPAPGGFGIAMHGGFLFAAASDLQGGPGGPAGSPIFGCVNATSGMGGTGLLLDGGAEVHLLGGTLAGGTGGFAYGTCSVGPVGEPAQVVDGTLEAVAWPLHGFAVGGPVQVGESATASFRGLPGEFVWYVFSESSQALFLPQVLGTLVLAPPLGIVPVGSLDAQGQAQATLGAALPPGAASQLFLLQALFLDTATDTFTLSSPATFVLLEAGA